MSASGFNVEYIAHLARFELSEAERGEFGAQLDSVLGYVQKIAALDVSNVEPMIQGFPVINVFRPDVPSQSLDRETMLQIAPQRIGDEVKTPKVVE